MKTDIPTLCTTENETKTDELLQAGASAHKRSWKMVRANSESSKMAGSLPRRPGVGRLNDKKEKMGRE